MQENAEELKAVCDAAGSDDSEIVRRKMVGGAFFLAWMSICIFAKLRFPDAHSSRGGTLTGGDAFIPFMCAVTVVSFVACTWVSDRCSLVSMWKLISTSEQFYKCIFDFFKNASIPIAMVAFVGHSLRFLGKHGIDGLPRWVLDALPPGINTSIAAACNVVLYVICSLLLAGAIRNAQLGLSGAAEAYAKSHEMIPDLFRRRSGVAPLLTAMAFAELLMFGVAFNYAALGA